jgi:hypothetical protein
MSRPTGPTTQIDAFAPPARARARDPETSREAASRVTNLRASQARVLAMFKLYGDLYDKALMDYLHDAERNAGVKPMSPSGVRSRRSELAKPNMDRLDEIAHENLNLLGAVKGAFGRITGPHQNAARAQLRTEGFRSVLWDTGERAVVDGRKVIVWGIAR